MSGSRWMTLCAPLLSLLLVACPDPHTEPVAPAPPPKAPEPPPPPQSLDDYRAGLGRANALYKAERYAEALEAFQALATAFPERAAAHYGLWMTYGKLGDRENEARAMARLRQVSGKSVVTHDQMAQAQGSGHGTGHGGAADAEEFFFLSERTPLFVDELKREVRLFTRMNGAYLESPGPALVGGETALLRTSIEQTKLHRALLDVGGGGEPRPVLDVFLTWEEGPTDAPLAKLLGLSGAGFVLGSDDEAAAARAAHLVSLSDGVMTPKEPLGEPSLQEAPLPADGTAVMVVLRTRR